MIFYYFSGLPLSNPGTTLVAYEYLAVDLFVILSGFVMALSYGQMFKPGWSVHTYIVFLGRRVARIYPLYAIVTLAFCALIGLGVVSKPGSVAFPTAAVLNLLVVQS